VGVRETCGGILGTADVEALDDDSIVDVILCRLDQLKQVGCDAPDCVVVAGRLDVRLEAAIDLVARGCPPNLVLPILL
jgi:hypothetical protein